MIVVQVSRLDWEYVARASAHELQIAILEALAVVAGSDDPSRSPSQVTELVDAPLGVVSYHFRMLRDRGLIVETRTEPRRGALAHFYRLADGAIAW